MMFVGVTACGDDSSDESVEDTVENEADEIEDDGGDEGGGGDEVTLSVNAIDFAFDPATSTISAGEETTVQVVNEGADIHTWVVMRPGVSVEDYFNSYPFPPLFAGTDNSTEDVLTKASAPGGTEGIPVTFTIQEAGTYQVICDLHLEEGMVGELVVE
jgi:plastocyanin